MANVVVTIKMMPDSPDTNLEEVGQKIEEVVKEFGKLYKKSTQPVAFGINAMVYAVIMAEKEGGTDPIEEALKKVDGVSDVQVTDVTRIVDVEDL